MSEQEDWVPEEFLGKKDSLDIEVYSRLLEGLIWFRKKRLPCELWEIDCVLKHPPRLDASLGGYYTMFEWGELGVQFLLAWGENTNQEIDFQYRIVEFKDPNYSYRPLPIIEEGFVFSYRLENYFLHKVSMPTLVPSVGAYSRSKEKENLMRFIIKTLEKDPSKRFEDLLEICKALVGEDALDDLRVRLDQWEEKGK